MNVFSGAQNQLGERYLELKYRTFCFIRLCWDFCVRKSLSALKSVCLSFIGILGGNLSEKKMDIWQGKFVK